MADHDDKKSSYFGDYKRKDMQKSSPGHYSDKRSNSLVSTLGRLFVTGAVNKLEKRIEEIEEEQRHEDLFGAKKEEKVETTKLSEQTRKKILGFVDVLWFIVVFYIAFKWFFPFFADGLRNSSAMGAGVISALLCLLGAFIVTLPIRWKIEKWLS